MTKTLQEVELLGLTRERLIDMYKMMCLTRLVDERMILLHRMGKIPFVVSGVGQEATQIGASFAFDPTVDYALPYYRDYGVVMVFGQSPTDLMYSAFAKEADPNSGGRQMVAHFGGRKFHIPTQSSPTGSQLPQAAGVALALKMRREPGAVYVSFGEGASSQGDCHEAMNFAGIHRLPVVFVCVNNQYSLSTPVHLQVAGGSVAARAAGYGFPGITVDGNDVLEVFEATREAVRRAKAGEGPTLIEALTYRLKAHSGDDDHLRYRHQEEVDEALKRDPIPRFRDQLLALDVWNSEREQELLEALQRQIQEATDAADRAPLPKAEALWDHVYADESRGGR